MAVPQVCIYFKYGHCKYKNNCRNRHIEDLCDTDNCDGRACEKRHPKSCRYFEIFGRCKYNPCSCSHVAGSLVHDKLGKLESLIDVMKHKIDVLKQSLVMNEEKTKELEFQVSRCCSQEKRTSHIASSMDGRGTTSKQPRSFINSPMSVHTTSSIGRSDALLPFWTKKGSSCCYHECRPDDKPPGKCCYHRCRELWD